MICPRCGQGNREGRKFCSQCAGPLHLQCPSCRALNEPGEKFCGDCGSPLTGDAGDPAVPIQRATAPVPTSPSAGLRTSFANGRYQVKKFLGEGGKKKVYLAHDTLLDRDVAFA